MKKLIKAATSSSNTLTGPYKDVEKAIIKYLQDCYEASGIESKYPNIYATSDSAGWSSPSSGKFSVFSSGSVYLAISERSTDEHMFTVGFSLVTNYTTDPDDEEICLGAVNYRCSYGWKLRKYGAPESIVGGHQEDAWDYIKKNKVPQKRQVYGLYDSISELLPKQKCIDLMKEYAATSYDLIFKLPEFQAREKENKRQQEELKKQALSQANLQEEIDKKLGAESHYQVGVRIYNNGYGSSVNSEYTDEFTAPGDYFALFYLVNGHEDVNVDKLKEEFYEDDLKEWLMNNKTVRQLAKDLDDRRYPDEYTKVVYMKNLDTGKYIFGSNRNSIESSYDASGLVIL